jgi:O-antigen/teichoic acid export membrane protein
MVKSILGPEQAGYYSIAATLADYVLMLPAVIGSILFPRLSAESDHATKVRFSSTVTLGTAAVLLPLVIVCGLSAKVAIHLVFGRAFEPAALAFVYLLPGVFLLGVQTVAVQFLNSIGYPKSVISVWAVTTALNVGLNFWAIPRYGIVGASVVSSITYSVVCLFVLMIIFRHRECTPIAAGFATDRTS